MPTQFNSSRIHSRLAGTVIAAACRAGRGGRSLRLLLCGFALLAAASPAQAQQPPVQPIASNEVVLNISARRTAMQIVEKFAKTVALDKKILRVDGFDPAVINVSALSPYQLRVQALTPGVTTMVLVDENQAVYEVEIFVAGDVRHLQAYIDKFFPKASVQAVAVRDSVVLRGWVSKPEQITELVEIAEQFYPRVLNQMKVGGVQQVMLKVKVIEVQRTKIRQLGLNFFFRDNNFYFASTPGQLTPLAGLTTTAGSPPVLTPQATALLDPSIAFGIVRPNAVFNAFLEALKQESLLKILAEPNLTTTNGRPATLLAGGEFPILVPQSLGTVTIEWREFGTRLEAVPIILGNDRLRLEIQPEVSDRDFSNSVTVQGNVVPGLTTRRANTQVEMKFGETLMIAGLLSTRKTAVVDKIPLVGEMPWIGAAFRRTRYDETETELVIMVTPELVAPMPCEQVPYGGPGLFTDVPTDREFYRDGMLEVPSYGDCTGQGCGLVGPGCAGPGYPMHGADPSYSAGPGAMTPGGIVPPPPPNGAIVPSPSNRTLSPPPPEPAPALPPQAAPPGDGKTNATIEQIEGRKLWARDFSRDDFGGQNPATGASQSLYQPGTQTSSGTQPSTATRTTTKPAGRVGLIEPKPGMIGP